MVSCFQNIKITYIKEIKLELVCAELTHIIIKR